MKNRHFDYFNRQNSYTCLISIPLKKSIRPIKDNRRRIKSALQLEHRDYVVAIILNTRETEFILRSVSFFSLLDTFFNILLRRHAIDLKKVSRKSRA